MPASLSLYAEPLELELSPSTGGAISRLDHLGARGSTPVLRRSNTPLENVLESSCFPLVPFVNRVRGGSFTFRGREVQLTPNMEGDPSPLHGQGWRSPWQVESAGHAEAVLRFLHDPGEWPWRYEARQHFRLDGAGLSVRLSCRNLSDEPMPCGLGHHPYFNCGPGTRIETQVTHVWTIDEDVLPVEKVPASGRFDLSGRPACGQGLDHGFAGWSGRARLIDPDWPFDVELSSASARFFQLYSPESGGIFVAEPVSHANAALNAPEEDWRELGLRVLEQGDRMELEMRLDVTTK